MPLYVDLGVKRVQEYIMRTSGAKEKQLRLRRGASRMVAECTDASKFTDLGFIKNDEIYVAEGVAHLIYHGDSEGEKAAHTILDRTRRGLPAAYFDVSWCEADTYEQALTQLENLRASGRVTVPNNTYGIIQSFPPPREDPFASRCSGCGSGYASREDLCEDCHLRDERGKNATPSKNSADTPEIRTLRAVNKQLETSDRRKVVLCKELSELAKCPVGQNVKRNHLATIYADGNNVGALFQSIPDLNTKCTVSEKLNDAIQRAGETALVNVLQHNKSLRVLPATVTVLAADDALMTVPAAFAWQTVRDLIATFDALVRSESLGLKQVTESSKPLSLTAGLVFHEIKTPIELVIADADAAMRAAKKNHPGTPSIGFIDMTQPLDSAVVRTNEWFNDHEKALNTIAVMAGSQCAKWERDIHIARANGISDEHIEIYIRNEITRLGLPSMTFDNCEELETMLNVVRWWPDTSKGA